MYSDFYEHLHRCGLGNIAGELSEKVQKKLKYCAHGDLQTWLKVVENMPKVAPEVVKLDENMVEIGTKSDLNEGGVALLSEELMQLHPWRKGPFKLFGIEVDTEWRSDMKWDRLKDEIKPLQGKRVLDVGCGNGYFCLRMLGEGAKAVVGIDPFWLFVVQFQALNKYIRTNKASVLPLGIEDMPKKAECFDTVFSMGVLYHRKDAFGHVMDLYGQLKEGGEVVLETLIIDSDMPEVFRPEGRYAKMRNVWEIPSVSKCIEWLEKAGFKNPRAIDVTKTTLKEQSPTKWMQWESLPDFLDENDANKTIEGFPAPVRAVILADK